MATIVLANLKDKVTGTIFVNMSPYTAHKRSHYPTFFKRYQIADYKKTNTNQ